MSRNHRKHANTIKVAAFAWWMIIFTVLCGIGLCYVYIKNQTVTFGNQRLVCEHDLRDFSDQNRALTSRITALTSRSALQRKLAVGLIEMVEIDPVKIVRLNENDSTMARLNETNDAEMTRTVAQK